jgi:hypothetical protein
MRNLLLGRWPGFVQVSCTRSHESFVLPYGEDSALACAGMSQSVIDRPAETWGQQDRVYVWSTAGVVGCLSSMLGRPKRSRVERTLTFGSVPRGPLATR